MRAEEVYTRPSVSMKDIALLKSEIAELQRATATFNVLLNIVTVNFKLDGADGVLVLEAKPDAANTAQQVLKNKLVAVGRTQLGGKKPRDMAQIATLMSQGFGNRALQILLNGLSVRAIRYAEIDWRAV